MSDSPLKAPRVTFKVRIAEVCWAELIGVIDETFDRQSFLESLKGSRAPLVLDLSEVKSITSFGVREWVVTLRALPSSYYCFVGCRPAIVSQFNMVAGFAGKGQLVRLFLPYHCDSCNADFEKVFDLRKRHAEIAKLLVPEEKCPTCGKDAEFDDLPESYLSFVAAAPPPSPPPAVSNAIDGVESTVPFRVDKEVSGVVTALWMRGTLDKAARLKRLGDGLEGQVLAVLKGLSLKPDGLSSFSAFLALPGFDLYLACIPSTAAKQIAPQGWGRAKLVAVDVPARCVSCGYEGEISVTGPGTGARACPSCQKEQFEAKEAEVLAEVAALPFVPAPVDIQRYLAEHEEGPTTESVSAPTAANALGKYQLVARIGAGGMAEIFLARLLGPQGFEKKVVLKRILPHLAADQQFIEMFFQEARIAARISHPNVVQIFELGNVGDQHYMALEYVRGSDLNVILKLCRDLKIQVPVEFACRIVADICAGLYAAHTTRDDEGQLVEIIHRDVSPHNVLVSAEGSVKLTDFGVARAAQSNHTTRPGTLKGKLCYMAPEQVDKGMVDGRVDIFAAAIVLYQCLTLEQIFRRDSDVETLMAILKAPIPHVRALRPDVPLELEEKLERGLARDLTVRYATAQLFQLALEESIAAMGRPATPAHLSLWLKDLFAKAVPSGLLGPEGNPMTPSRTKSPSEIEWFAVTPSSSGEHPTSPTMPLSEKSDPKPQGR